MSSLGAKGGPMDTPPMDTPQQFAAWRHEAQSQVEQALSQRTTIARVDTDPLHSLQAMLQYAVLDGGKRLRPLLVLASDACVRSLSVPWTTGPQAYGDGLVWDAACAVELIHAYSLVHDDMPCMDNDFLRRGKATVHAAYGDANALLVGDSLHALAFDVLTQTQQKGVRDQDYAEPNALTARQIVLCRMLAKAAGVQGMAGGQYLDLQAVGHTLSEAQLRHMHALKTGALIEASVMMGAVCAGDQHVSATEFWVRLQRFAQRLGVLYQVVDDILDATEDSATLGKTAGKDASQNKPTYVTVLGLAQAQSMADSLFTEAQTALSAVATLGADTALLSKMLDWVAHRAH